MARVVPRISISMTVTMALFLVELLLRTGSGCAAFKFGLGFGVYGLGCWGLGCRGLGSGIPSIIVLVFGSVFPGL